MSVVAEITTLRQATVAELVARYTELHGHEPRTQNKQWLFRRIAWRLQADQVAPLSNAAQSRLDALVAEIELPPARTAGGHLGRRPHAPGPTPGTVLTRAWHGRELRARVLEDGDIEVDGVRYGSLSAAAKGITGSKWNGRLFWGLTTRRSAS